MNCLLGGFCSGSDSASVSENDHIKTVSETTPLLYQNLSDKKWSTEQQVDHDVIWIPPKTNMITMTSSDDQNEHVAVTRFREFLRIKTVHPTPDYASAKLFLQAYAKEIGLDFQSVEVVSGKPICIMTWRGSNPSLKSIMLNSHMDVVPITSVSNWSVDPFSGIKLPNGDIVSRGAQDMKCVTIHHMESIRSLKSDGFQPIRSVHVVVVPDEEIGGDDGMFGFTHTDAFRDLNVGMVMDEGLVSEQMDYKLYYADRAVWWITLTSHGSTGHGSQFIEPNAMTNMMSVLTKLTALRESEKRRLEISNESVSLGDVVTVNINMMRSGVQVNVVPDTVTARVDIRVSPQTCLESLRNQILDWCTESNVNIVFDQDQKELPVTKLDSTNVYWGCIQEASKKVGIELQPGVFPASTDSRFLRALGVPCFGVTCIRNTKVLLHGVDERVNERQLMEGLKMMVEIVKRVSSVGADLTESISRFLS